MAIEEEIIYKDPNQAQTPVVEGAAAAVTPTAGAVTPTTTTPATASTGGLAQAKSYANWLYNSAMSLATEQKNATIEASNIARKRSIADANSAYLKSKATYGQNAEKLASMGLSGSGYGEYLTSNAYAQNRSAVQTANAQDLATQKEALYNEKIAKQEAQSQYYSNMLQIQSQQNNAYSALLNAANSGASIESLMASGDWGYIDANQQTQIKNIAQTNSFKLQIDGGKTIDDIMLDQNYSSLSADSQQILQNYYQKKKETDAVNSANAYNQILDYIDSGIPLADLQSMPGFASATESQMQSYKSREALYKAKAQILAGNSTLKDIQNGDLWAQMNENDRAELNTYANDIANKNLQTGNQYDNYVSNVISDIMSGKRTLSQIREDEYYKQGTANGSITEEDLKNIQDASTYRDLLASIQNGDSFATIQESENFKGLEKNYQDLLMAEARSVAYNKINNMLSSMSLDDIQKNYASEWELLTADQQGQIAIKAKDISETEKQEQLNTFLTLSELIKSGTSIADIQKGAWSYLYNDLSQEVKADLANVEKEYKDSLAESEWLAFKDDLKNGTWSLEDIQKFTSYQGLNETQKKDLESFDAAEKIKDILDSTTGKTLDDIKKENPDLWKLVEGTQYENEISGHSSKDASTEGFNSDSAHAELLKYWKSGNYTSDAIKDMELYKHLNKEDREDLESRMIYDTGKKTVETMIANNADWRTIVNSSEYQGISEEDRVAINRMLNERAQAEKDRLSALIQSGKIKTQDQLEAAANFDILVNTEDVETDAYIDDLIDELDQKILSDSQSKAAADVSSMLAYGDYSWEDIENSDAYKGLASDELREIAKNQYLANLDAALDEMIDDANSTGNLDYVKRNKWYDKLDDASKSLIDNAIDTYNRKNSIDINQDKDTLRAQISANIESNAYGSLQALRNEDGFSLLDEGVQNQFVNDWLATYADSMNASYSADNVDGLKKRLQKGIDNNEYSVEESKIVFEKWQENNLTALAEVLTNQSKKITLAEAKDLVGNEVIPEDSIEALRKAGLIDSNSNSISELYDKFNNGNASAEEVIEQSGTQTIGSDNIGDVTVGSFSGATAANFEATINGKTYKVQTGSKVSEDAIVKELNKLATGNENTTPSAYVKGGTSASIVMYEGEAYIYTSYNGKSSWKKITNRLWNKEAYNGFLAALIANQK